MIFAKDSRFDFETIRPGLYIDCVFKNCDLSEVGDKSEFRFCKLEACTISANGWEQFQSCQFYGGNPMSPIELDATLPPGTYLVSRGGLRDGAILTARNGQRYRMGPTLRLDGGGYTFDPEEGGALYLAAGTTITGPDQEVVDAPRLFRKRGTWRDGLS